MRKPILTLLMLFLLTGAAVADSYPRNPNIDVLHYVFHIQVHDQTKEMSGQTSVAIQFLSQGIEEFHLDLIGKSTPFDTVGMMVMQITRDGDSLQFEHQNNRIRIKMHSPSEAGESRIYTISYVGIPADGLIISKNRHGDRTFFGDNWPNRARHWLPTVDHPSDKATCEFVIESPNRYQVVANGLLMEETDLSGDRRLTHWLETTPIPTKVMVIGIARFAVQHVENVHGISVQSWVYPQDREAGFYDYSQAVPILKYFSEQIGAFPYGKLANVQSKTRYGGMENASAIFYNENSVKGKRENESLIAHEIAHQWFGDSITEADWHHIWLSESFATYFASLYFESAYGREQLIERMQSARERVFTYYEKNSNTSIVDTSISNLNKLLNPNSYQKGAWVLHMLRYVVGDDVFWQGIREFYRLYRDQNALTKDFRRVMEKVSGQKLDWFFQQWVFRPGHLKLNGAWDYSEKTKKLKVRLRQVQNGPPLRMPIELAIYQKQQKSPQIENLQLTTKEHEVSFLLKTAPSEVILDPNSWLLATVRFHRKK
ncbi:MAG: M1 family aminopeptidase [bacterium]